MKKLFECYKNNEFEGFYELFDSFNTKGEIYNYFNVSDSSKNIKIINDIAKKINFDFNVYKIRRKKKCQVCGKELNSGQTKFCSSSCAAKYNNTKRILTQETKDKIRKTLKDKKIKLSSPEYTLVDYQTMDECNESYIKNSDRLKQETKKNRNFCLMCGKELNSSQKKFCSSKCFSKYKHQENYKKFLDEPEKYNRGNYTPKAFREEFINEQGGVCAICGCKAEWNGKPLVFVIDHIDGDASNNKRENLRCICPNCDSQLETFKSKNKNSKRRNYWKEHIISKITSNNISNLD